MTIIERSEGVFLLVGGVLGAYAGASRAGGDVLGLLLGGGLGALGGGLAGIVAHYAVWGVLAAGVFLVDWWRLRRPPRG